jgi:sodium--glutamate symport carrier gltS
MAVRVFERIRHLPHQSEGDAAPRAFLIVPLVGAFFIDFTNAITITFFVNWLR